MHRKRFSRRKDTCWYTDYGLYLPKLATALHFPLHRLKGLLKNNGRVAVLDKELRHLAFIFYPLMCKKIHGDCFLQQSISCVLFVLQHFLEGGLMPNSAIGRGKNTVSLKTFAD